MELHSRELATTNEPLKTGPVVLGTFLCVLCIGFLGYGFNKLRTLSQRHLKYRNLMDRLIGDLMMLGFIYFVVLSLCYFKAIAYGGIVHYTVDAVVILLFFIALTFPLESLILFIRLRSRTAKMNSNSLLSALEIVKMTNTNNIAKQALEQKLVESYFREMYQLPKIFPFSKYICQVQERHLNHIVCSRVFGWVSLLILLVCFFLCTGELQQNTLYHDSLDSDLYKVSTPMAEHRLWVFGIFAGTLTLLMIFMGIYLIVLNRPLVQHATTFFMNMDPESTQNRLYGKALEAALVCITISDHRCGEMSFDDALEQIRSCEMKYFRVGRGLNPTAKLCGLCHKSSLDSSDRDMPPLVNELHQTTSVPYSRFFTWFLIQVFLSVNQLYYAILVVIVAPSLDNNQLPYLAALVAPLLINSIWLAPLLVHKFAFFDGTWYIRPEALNDVIYHLQDASMLQQTMKHRIREYLASHNMFVAEITEKLRQLDGYDRHCEGYIEIEMLYQVLRDYGFETSRDKFQTMMQIKYETKGAYVKYAGILEELKD